MVQLVGRLYRAMLRQEAGVDQEATTRQLYEVGGELQRALREHLLRAAAGSLGLAPRAPKRDNL